MDTRTTGGESVVGLELVDIPAVGRRYHGSRAVYLGDVDGNDELHLEALFRYLQDLATDDAYDAGLRELGGVWVVRRYAMQIAALPNFRDVLDLVTFCSGTGPCWAERRTSVTRGSTPIAEAVALWVFADETRGRPLSLGDEFFRIYGEAAGGRKVSSRLTHPPPPVGAARRPWVLRARDLDWMDHVNNARALEAVEDEVARSLPGTRVTSVSLEYRGALAREPDVELVSEVRPTEGDGAELAMWLLVGDDVRLSAVVTALPRADGGRGRT
jgi:acyl-ACP thioesterase